MSGLLDFLQGASNSAAANVSAPVDVLAWALRKAGLPIGDAPVGGSDWMRQKGLTAEPQNRNMGLLGEAFGGVAPMVVAAKAPQIARGLLQGAENLAAPRTLNPQTGAILWHGSPHKFDAFDASKIGTGEGAQAYGHGLYLADSPDVASSYRKTLTDRYEAELLRPAAEIQKKYKADPWVIRNIVTVAGRETKSENPDALLQFLKNRGGANSNAAARAFKDGVVAPKPTGSLYKVDLPDEHIAKMLDWDKPLSQQSKEVRKALEPLGYKYSQQAGAMHDDALLGALLNNSDAAIPKIPSNPMGSEIARGKGIFDQPQDKVIAEKLRQAGIPGIRYLDGGSRGAGAGSSNYVVFPGNEGLLSILERNGQQINR